jgi:flagellar biosynthesis/type III secretory pathway protein FliH
MVDEILWKEEIREEGHVKGLEEGLVKGLEEGLEKGMEKERKRIVSLIEQGVSLDDIKKILSKEKTPKKKRP